MIANYSKYMKAPKKNRQEEALKQVLLSMEQAVDENISTLLGMGYIPFETVEGRTLVYGVIDVNTRFIITKPLGKQSFKDSISKLLGKVLDKEEFETLLLSTVHIQYLTANPFLSWGFYMDEDEAYSKKWNFNNILFSEYHRKLKSEVGDKDIDLLLKLYRLSDSVHFHGFSFAEVIIAWKIFHYHKIMAILAIYSKFRGTGKSFLVGLAEYLYSSSNHHSFCSIVDVSNKKAFDWENNKVDIRLWNIEDVPQNKELVESLVNTLKSTATSMKEAEVNVKGGAMKIVNPYNISVTTNFIESIPIEGEGDRRLYPIKLDRDLLSDIELKRIKELKIPMVGDTTKYHPIVQKLLNHFKYIYDLTKNDSEIEDYLMRETPLSDFKKEVITVQSKRNQKAGLAIESSPTRRDIKEKMSLMFAIEESELDIIDNLPIQKLPRDKYHSMFIDVNNLKALSTILSGNGWVGKTKQILYSYFKDYELKSHTVQGKTKKAIKIKMPEYIAKQESTLEKLKRNGVEVKFE